MNDPGSKYHRTIRSVKGGPETIVDVYDVIEAFEVKCPGRQHAIKKLLCAGLRGKGSELDDLRETLSAVSRAVQLQEQREASLE